MSERPDSLRIFFFPCGPGLEALNIGSAGSVLQFVDFRPKDTKRFDTLTLRGEKEKRRKSDAEANNGKSRIRSWNLYSVNE
jgi:hypothetical protein